MQSLIDLKRYFRCSRRLKRVRRVQPWWISHNDNRDDDGMSTNAKLGSALSLSYHELGHLVVWMLVVTYRLSFESSHPFVRLISGQTSSFNSTKAVIFKLLIFFLSLNTYHRWLFTPPTQHLVAWRASAFKTRSPLRGTFRSTNYLTIGLEASLSTTWNFCLH